MFEYRIDVLAKLKEAGYSSYRIRKEKIFGESVLTQLRNKEIVSWGVMDTLCRLLGLDVGDIITYQEK